MDQPRDESKPVEPPMKAPTDTPSVQHPNQPTEKSMAGCIHLRLIDDVRTRNGKPTGKVRCLECGTIFDDPSHKAP